jgi:hypothetical protein
LSALLINSLRHPQQALRKWRNSNKKGNYLKYWQIKFLEYGLFGDKSHKTNLTPPALSKMACGLNQLNRNHFKIFFARTALRTRPIHGHLIPASAWGNAFFW